MPVSFKIATHYATTSKHSSYIQRTQSDCEILVLTLIEIQCSFAILKVVVEVDGL